MSPVDSSIFSTFGLGGPVRCLSHIRTKKDIENIEKNTLVVGSGSNMIFGDNLEEKALAKIEIMGMEVIKEADSKVTIKVGAGEDWDFFVKFCVDKGWSGLEALSNIPGTVGAAPIQNIGAYGSEVKNNIVEVEAFDTKERKWTMLANQDCQFDYRNSIFKQHPGRWIISHVVFQLDISDKNIPPSLPDYKDVKAYFESKPTLEINLHTIREAIIEIRKNKLPDPKFIPNCGSFFKNPIISKEETGRLKEKFPTIPLFPFGDEIKTSAGFLIEQVGFKGKEIHNIVVYKNNALVLTNPNRASFQNLMKAKEEIQKTVFEKFSIILESEVNIIEK